MVRRGAQRARALATAGLLLGTLVVPSLAPHHPLVPADPDTGAAHAPARPDDPAVIAVHPHRADADDVALPAPVAGTLPAGGAGPIAVPLWSTVLVAVAMPRRRSHGSTGARSPPAESVLG